MKTIDVRGEGCPIPLVKAKKALDAGEKELEILTDNEISVQNLLKMAAHIGIKAESKTLGEDMYRVVFNA